MHTFWEIFIYLILAVIVVNGIAGVFWLYIKIENRRLRQRLDELDVQLRERSRRNHYGNK